MTIIYLMTKKRTIDHQVRKWLTACHRKNVEVYVENR